MYIFILLYSILVSFNTNSFRHNFTYLQYSNNLVLYYSWIFIYISFLLYKIINIINKNNLKIIYKIYTYITALTMYIAMASPYQPLINDFYSNLHITFAIISTISFFYIIYLIIKDIRIQILNEFLSIITLNILFFTIIGSINVIIEESLVLTSLYFLHKLESNS